MHCNEASGQDAKRLLPQNNNAEHGVLTVITVRVLWCGLMLSESRAQLSCSASEPQLARERSRFSNHGSYCKNYNI